MTLRPRLTAEQRRTLAELEAAVLEGEDPAEPDSQAGPAQPGLQPYEFLIGIDDEGRRFPVHERGRIQPPRRPARQVSRRRSRDESESTGK